MRVPVAARLAPVQPIPSTVSRRSEGDHPRWSSEQRAVSNPKACCSNGETAPATHGTEHCELCTKTQVRELEMDPLTTSSENTVWMWNEGLVARVVGEHIRICRRRLRHREPGSLPAGSRELLLFSREVVSRQKGCSSRVSVCAQAIISVAHCLVEFSLQGGGGRVL